MNQSHSPDRSPPVRADNAAAEGNYHSPAAKSAQTVPQPPGEPNVFQDKPRLGGRPRTIFDYSSGKLAAGLAVGLSYREAECWVDVDSSTICRVLKEHEEFASFVDLFTRLARLHPFLRLYLATGESPTAADWFCTWLSKRTGEASVSDLQAVMFAEFPQIRPTLFTSEAGRMDFDTTYPIGEN